LSELGNEAIHAVIGDLIEQLLEKGDLLLVELPPFELDHPGELLV
jgi:hypothetical protein